MHEKLTDSASLTNLFLFFTRWAWRRMAVDAAIVAATTAHFPARGLTTQRLSGSALSSGGDGATKTRALHKGVTRWARTGMAQSIRKKTPSSKLYFQ